jgi:hypothetical protein
MLSFTFELFVEISFPYLEQIHKFLQISLDLDFLQAVSLLLMYSLVFRLNACHSEKKNGHLCVGFLMKLVYLKMSPLYFLWLKIAF